MWPDFGGTLKLSSMSGRVLVLYTGLFGICTLDLVGSTISSSVVQPVDPALKAAVSDEVFVFPSMKMDILSLVSKDILFGNRWIKHSLCLNLWSMIWSLALFNFFIFTKIMILTELLLKNLILLIFWKFAQKTWFSLNIRISKK